MLVITDKHKYWGFLKAVLDDGIILDNAVVWNADIRWSEKTQEPTETEILGNDAIIAIQIIEHIIRPSWVDKLLPGERKKRNPISSTDITGSILDKVRRLIGQKVAVICTRYQYRGILSTVASDGLELLNSAAVEVAGPSDANRPTLEDPIRSLLVIMMSSVELIYQPHWVHAPLPNDDGYSTADEEEEDSLQGKRPRKQQ